MSYQTVVMDPPWPIKGLNEPARFTKKRKPIYNELKKSINYNLMSMKEIYDFPIDKFAADESLLFIWVTCGKIEETPVLQHGLNMLEKWGFKYHTMLAWVKPQGIAYSSPIRGLIEPILFGWRGNFTELTGGHCGIMGSKIITDRQQASGRKPVEFYQRLRSWTPKPRIDIFARRAHEGFDGWGDQYVGNIKEGTLLEWM